MKDTNSMTATEKLARVQALLLYQIMRFYDSDVCLSLCPMGSHLRALNYIRSVSEPKLNPLWMT
jgi:hypothetical protein